MQMPVSLPMKHKHRSLCSVKIGPHQLQSILAAGMAAAEQLRELSQRGSMQRQLLQESH